MLEPRESDIPVLFLVLVVLPLVAYILLGKWSETTKKRDRINLLAHLAAEEALRAEEMAVADVIPPVSSSKMNIMSVLGALLQPELAAPDANLLDIALEIVK
ncbi:Ubiquitin carboxyl-terminal hydrolase 15 [Spatholobus suberectus]|nr:Ubiquitin carboxyl-terminal hydrolase 15 [Spatholobus suberectus]